MQLYQSLTSQVHIPYTYSYAQLTMLDGNLHFQAGSLLQIPAPDTSTDRFMSVHTTALIISSSERKYLDS